MPEKMVVEIPETTTECKSSEVFNDEEMPRPTTFPPHAKFLDAPLSVSNRLFICCQKRVLRLRNSRISPEWSWIDLSIFSICSPSIDL